MVDDLSLLAAELGERTDVRHSTRDGNQIFYGGDSLRKPFVAAMERMNVGGYEIRPADASDLLGLMTTEEYFEGVSS